MLKRCLLSLVAFLVLCSSAHADIKCVLDYSTNSIARGGGTLYALEISQGSETNTYVAKFTYKSDNKYVLDRENITYAMPCQSGAKRNKAQLVYCSNLSLPFSENTKRSHIYEEIRNSEVSEAKLNGADANGDARLVQNNEYRFQVSSELLQDKKFEFLKPMIKKILNTQVGIIEINFPKNTCTGSL